MAHFAVGFLALGLLALVLARPAWIAPLLVIPVLLSASIIRLPHRGRPGHASPRARCWAARRCAWEDIEAALRRGSWARAQLKDGRSCGCPR